MEPATPKTLCSNCVETLEDHAGNKCLYGPTSFDYFCCVFCKKPIEDNLKNPGIIVTLEDQMNYLTHAQCIRKEADKVYAQMILDAGLLSWEESKREAVRRCLKEN